METTGGGGASYQIGVTPGLSNGWGYTSSPGPASSNVLSVSGTETHYATLYTSSTPVCVFIRACMHTE